ncbi:MAG: ATP-dependent RNA helicase [Treponema sp.]|nr:ATP-dependent RNA helicase [Treponema sp.]
MNYIELPVYKNQQNILSVLENNQALVVESPTGSGKTTQLPVILYNAGYAKNGIIGVTQPRRIAAMSVSEFIARQTNTVIPGLIGYKMRFDDLTNHETKIKIMTDGILLQEMKLDPFLSKYSVLIIDEAHERSLNIDFILGLLKRVMEHRPDFKVIISSATINADVFSEYLGECPIVKIDAQRFPVTLIYDPINTNSYQSTIYNEQSAKNKRKGTEFHEKKRDSAGNNSSDEMILVKIEGIVTRFVSEKREGDILIFLSGEKMIKECMGRLTFSSVGKYLHILPLYGRLGKEEQEKVFEETPKGKTKVVISTNIAETSVTINGIACVIDSGLAKLNWYNPRSFTSSLIEAPISKASANQRKGRAGRTREGICYRLYTRKDFENRSLYTAEEIFRTDLSEVILRMAVLGITNFEDFDFITAPDKSGIIGGIDTLNLLEALESDRSLSNIGKLMTEFPLAPRHSRIIVEAIQRYPDIIRETIIAAAFLSTQSPYILPPGEETDARQAHHRFRDENGDFVSYLKLFKSYKDSTNKLKFCEKNYLDERAAAEIANVVYQLEEILASMKIPVHYNPEIISGSQIDDYLCCIGCGMIQFVCVREGSHNMRGRSSSYRSLTENKIIIHPGSVMFRKDPSFIVAGEIIRTSRMYAMSVSPLSKSVLQRLSTHLHSKWAGISSRLFVQTEFEKTGSEPAKYDEYGKSKGQKSETKKPQKQIIRDWSLSQNSVSFETGFRKSVINAAFSFKSKEAVPKTEVLGQPHFTNHIKIEDETFEISTFKGKKTVLLPWEKLDRIKDHLNSETVYKKLKGKIIINNQFNLLEGEKLELILSLSPTLDVDGIFNRRWPRKENFNSRENLCELLKHIENLAKPVIWKKNRSGDPVRDLGFLGLFTDGSENYRFRASRGFHTCVNESLASLEALIDELDEDVDLDQKHIVNQCYRRLSDYLG